VQEFQKIGANLIIKDDILYIHGEKIPAFLFFEVTIKK
jgi:hypothetical protein